MEYIDVIDERGQKIGKTASKEEAHSKGLWHRTVHIWFTNGAGDLLLQLRSREKENHPNMWDISVAGHISVGETSIDAARREIEEEIGLDLPLEKVILIGEVVQRSTQNNGMYINNEYNNVYLVTKELDTTTLRLQPGEVEEIRWIPAAELQEMVKNNDPKLVSHPKEYDLIFKHLGILENQNWQNEKV